MIEIQNATKRFGSLAALEHLNLQIKPGCIYGLVGPNGSGKSTLLRLISGVYRADEGRVLLDGSPAWENPATKDKIHSLIMALMKQGKTKECKAIITSAGAASISAIKPESYTAVWEQLCKLNEEVNQNAAE